MATFNATTGAVSVGTTVISPIADGSNLDENYSNLISTGIQTNSPNFPKSIQTLKIRNIVPGSTTVINNVITDTTKLPGVIMITVENPSLKVLAYVDQSGNSKYIVKVDPSNISKLVPYGVQITWNPPPSQTAVSVNSGIPWWIIACLVLVLFMGVVVFTISMRK